MTPESNLNRRKAAGAFRDRSCLELALMICRGCSEGLQTAKQIACGINERSSVEVESVLLAARMHYTEAQNFADEHLFLLNKKNELLFDCDGRPIRTELSTALGFCKDSLLSAGLGEQHLEESELPIDQQVIALSVALRSSGWVRANFALAIFFALPYLPALSCDRWRSVARRKLAEAQLVDPFTMVDNQFLRYYVLSMERLMPAVSVPLQEG